MDTDRETRASFSKVFKAAGTVEVIKQLVEATKVPGIEARYHGCHIQGQDANLKLYIEERGIPVEVVDPVRLKFIDSEEKTLITISAKLKAEQMALAENWWGELIRLLTEAGYSPSDKSSVMGNSLEGTEPENEERSQMDQVVEFLKKFGVWVTFLTLLLSGILSPFGLDTLAGAYAFLGTAFIFALARWRVWSIPPEYGKWRMLLFKGMTFLLIIACAVVWGYFLWWASRPHFEITAFDTLESDKNAYELTDHLIWNQDNLAEYSVGITFTLEIRPTYFGRQRFGQVVAYISGDGDNPKEETLWDDFTKASSTQKIELTLSDILDASGLKENSNPPSNPFRLDDLPLQQTNLTVQIMRAARRARPWDSEEITIRNAPWDLRSDLVWRDGRREVDVYVRNLGGTGGFTVRYYLVRLEEEIGSSSHPMNSGTTPIEAWNEPGELVYLKKGEFFTDSVSLPSELARGRYLIEIYPVKEQHYIRFEDPGTTWEDLNSMKSPWWFSGPEKSQRFIFVVTDGLEVDATIQAEWEHLRNEQGVDLGLAIEPVEEVTSATGTVGLRQEFQKGEIHLHNGHAYALYGPILEHYRELGGVQNEWLGFPISQVQTVTSSSGAEGTMMEFEGPGSPHASTLIYASKKGVATTGGWIGWVHAEDNGGHSGWLGFPLADEQDYADSTVQMFEHGYIVYHYPYVEGERDWGLEPIAFPYLASRGTLFAVHARQLWQDTGLQVQPGDRVTIIQVGGSWATREDEELFDANGKAEKGLSEDAELPSATIGTLIGRIGEDDGHVFSAGRWSVFTSSVEGTLYLAMNDNAYEDNAGFITVQIMVEHSD